MGEKTGGLTIMVTVLVVAVAIIAITKTTFPEVTEVITDKMKAIVSGTPNV